LECGGKPQRDTALDRRYQYLVINPKRRRAALCRRTPKAVRFCRLDMIDSEFQ
jgi:hypothetical protein